MSYLSTVLADAPVHYWRCADPGGNLLHDIGSAPWHMLAGFQDDTGWSGVASDGGSANFSLNAHYANTGDTVNYPGGALTFECWVWVTQNMPAAGNLMTWMPGGPIALNRTGTSWNWGYGGGASASALHYTAHAWHHLVGVWTGAVTQLYIDALAAAPGAGAAVAAGPGLLTLGEGQAGAPYFGALVAEAAVYFSALSAARVSAHYLAADNLLRDPVWSAAGGAGAVALNPQYTSNFQQLLIDLHSTYQNSP